MLIKFYAILFYAVIILLPNNIYARDEAEKLLQNVAKRTKETQSLAGDYEIIRRHLDPFEEIRERGRFSLLKPNYLNIRGANFLPSKTIGEWRKLSEATGYVSNGDVFYTLFTGQNGITYKEEKVTAAGKNISVSLSPIADFFNENNSFIKQIEEFRHRKILTSLRYAGEKDWENAKYKVLEFVTDEVKNGVSKNTVTQLYVDGDDFIRRSIVTEKLADLTSETETVLRNVSVNTNLQPKNFSYALPATAKVYVPPPTPLTSGTLAPDVTLIDTRSGKTVKLSDFRGKTVILDFWATWCLPCLKSFPHTAQVAKNLPDREIIILAVNIWDSKANAANRVAKKPEFNSFVFATDIEGVAPAESSTALFRVANLPLQYVISPNGRIVNSFQGYLGPSDELETAVKNADKFKP